MNTNEIADLARCAFAREVERLKKDPIVQKIVEDAFAAAGCGGQYAEEIDAKAATITELEAKIAELEAKIAELEAPNPEAPKRGRPPKADK